MRKAWETGDVEGSPMMVGQSIGLIRDIPTCKELIERIVKEAGEHISNASDKFDGLVKSPNSVTPAKAGVQKLLK